MNLKQFLFYISTLLNKKGICPLSRPHSNIQKIISICYIRIRRNRGFFIQTKNKSIKTILPNVTPENYVNNLEVHFIFIVYI